MNIDFEKLRNDLINYFGTAYISGFSMALIETSEVQTATNDKLIEIAIKNNFNLNDYTILIR